METLDAIAESRLKLLEGKHLRRRIVPARRDLVSFSSNDYLGLSRHPDVIAAAQAALAQGAGAGASRLAGGSYPLYAELESLLAAMKGTEAACVFSSGYLANIGAVPALMDANDLILADKLTHACMLDGARLSGATVMRFAHNNIEHCEMLLAAHRADFQRCLVCTETVFSMDGDRAPVSALAALAKKYDAWLMTDDAHGLGIVSDAEHSAADIQMGTLSKAAGTLGGYVCGSSLMVELLHNAARSLIFSTALPPAVVASAIAALKIIRDDKALCALPVQRAKQFAALLALPEPESAIVPVLLGEAQRALEASRLLEENGFFVAAIRPPTVPAGASRLRFAFTAQHTEAEVEQAAALLRAHGFA